MDLTREISKQVEKLPPASQRQVLMFVTSLAAATRAGESGARSREFAGTLDRHSARQMGAAIEQECERIDAGGW